MIPWMAIVRSLVAGVGLGALAWLMAIWWLSNAWAGYARPPDLNRLEEDRFADEHEKEMLRRQSHPRV